MIKVLIVDDSRVVQQFMTYLLSSDPGLQVVGVASSGDEALDLVDKLRPDVVTMDIHMPGMNGYVATRAIMEMAPTPVVIVSGSTSVSQVANAFKLFEVGALAVVLRPPGMEDDGFSDARKQLIQTVKLMSAVKVVRRFPNRTIPSVVPPSPGFQPEIQGNKNIQLIAIGASTGGPIVLKTILTNLPKDLPVPVVIVQHIAKGFINGLRDWLADSSSIPISIAFDGEILQPRHAYLAPDDFQMGIRKGNLIKLEKLPPEHGLCPAVDFLFRSVAEVSGANAVGVLLTGMGKDGAKELKTMKDRGGTTIAQDEASSVIFGMPGEAVRIGAATQVLPPEKIAEMLSVLCKK